MSAAPLEHGYEQNAGGIYVPGQPVCHRDEEYDQAGFDILCDMQSRHFWYQGRHRFLLRALKDQLGAMPGRPDGLRAIDLGGGCGGWISYLNRRLPRAFSELALGDSSLRALELAGPVVGTGIGRYQIDLLNLGWQGRWDVAFLLDVIEHIPQDADALSQVSAALRPGGLVFVTTPALNMFWSYNDDLAHHARRYSRGDFVQLAEKAGLQLRLARYFMFFLSPLLWLSRLKHPSVGQMSPEELCAMARRTHRVPAAPVNWLLEFIFDLETPLGFWLPFPWGTSILGVFQKAN
jgi:2-polyprenyl-3-methyl-5-hydroxy-6-metoxy-1,4-benzoquinol methylase